MKVNVDVLVLNQVRSQPNSVAIINQGKVSENQYQTYIPCIQAMMFPLQKFTIQMFRSTWCRIHIPKYFSPFNLMLIILVFFPRTFNMSKKVKNPIYQPNWIWNFIFSLHFYPVNWFKQNKEYELKNLPMWKWREDFNLSNLNKKQINFCSNLISNADSFVNK